MRVVVTGMGVVSPIGLEPDTFWNNLVNGITGFKPISLFNTSRYRCKLGGEVSNFDPGQYVDPRSVKKYDRVQLLDIAAAKMAWENAGLNNGSPYQPEELGVVLGSTYGYIDSVSSFYLEALKDGPAYVSPIQFSNTVMNAPAGKIAIRYNLTGLCSTIATGESSGIDAMSYAADFIRDGRCKAILVGAGSALCEGTFLGFHHTCRLSGSKNGEKESCTPFDKRGNGIILGEGAGVIVLESLENAVNRNANILAEVKGFGSHFNPYKVTKKRVTNGEDIKTIDANVESAIWCMKPALDEAGISPPDISLISANANSTPITDGIEARAIERLFSGTAGQVPVTAIKSMVGECLDATGMMQVIAGICSIRDNKIPPIPDLETAHTERGLNYVLQPRSLPVDSVLVNAFSCSGKKASVVLTRYSPDPSARGPH